MHIALKGMPYGIVVLFLSYFCLKNSSRIPEKHTKKTKKEAHRKKTESLKPRRIKALRVLVYIIPIVGTWREMFHKRAQSPRNRRMGISGSPKMAQNEQGTGSGI